MKLPADRPRPPEPKCYCGNRDDLLVANFGDTGAVLGHRVLGHRGMPYWWLHLSSCEHCGQHWLVAQEERFNDVYVMRKVEPAIARQAVESGDWPPQLDSYEQLIEIGREHGHAARYCDQFETLPIVIDFVRQRPSITPERIAELLGLDDDVARQLDITARSKAARGESW